MANSATYKHIVNADVLLNFLKQMPEEMRNKILGMGVEEVVKPILIAAKRFAKRSERTGALRESLTSKVKVYRNGGKAVGLVGPDRNYYRAGKRLGKLGAIYGDARPSRYAHLVEYGHVAVARIKGTSRRKGTAREIGFVQPRPFLRPAVATTTKQQEEAFFKGIAAGYKAAQRKLIRAGAHKAS